MMVNKKGTRDIHVYRELFVSFSDGHLKRLMGWTTFGRIKFLCQQREWVLRKERITIEMTTGRLIFKKVKSVQYEYE